MSVPPPVVSLGTLGPVVLSTDVDLALIAALQKWAPTYLRPMSQKVPTSKAMPLPRTYTNTVENYEWLDHQLPAIVVETSSAIAAVGGPNTFYRVDWRTAVSVIVRGRRPQETRRLASIFMGAVTLCVVQKGRTPDVIDDLRYLSMTLGPVPDATDRTRYLAGATAVFTTMTNVAVQGSGGPEIPDADSYVGEATVTEIDLTIAGESVSIGGTGGS
ncbi:MAG TPA: hypothetical protein VGG82_07660 [Casimicrobiaceae bacterium]|jgi:hypothetical protein